MSDVYKSTHTGEELDRGLDIVLKSGVTQAELARNHGAQEGTVSEGKVVVAGSDRSVSNLTKVVTDMLKTQFIDVSNSGIPQQNPENGRVLLFMNNGFLFLKHPDGSVTPYMNGGRVEEFPFSGISSVSITHSTGTMYPSVTIVGSNNKELNSEVEYVNGTTLKVTFNHIQSGKVIVRG